MALPLLKVWATEKLDTQEEADGDSSKENVGDKGEVDEGEHSLQELSKSLILFDVVFDRRRNPHIK